MSGHKVIGSGAAAGAVSLPVTGSPIVGMVLASLGAMAAGLLLYRIGRIRKSDAA